MAQPIGAFQDNAGNHGVVATPTSETTIATCRRTVALYTAMSRASGVQTLISPVNQAAQCRLSHAPLPDAQGRDNRLALTIEPDYRFGARDVRFVL